MPFEFGKVKLKLAVGLKGGAVVIDLFETNGCLDADVDEFCAYADEMFFGGTPVPKKGGIYMFEGKTIRDAPGGDEWWHEGVFTAV